MLKPCHICHTLHYNACPSLWGGTPERPIGPTRQDGAF